MGESTLISGKIIKTKGDFVVIDTAFGSMPFKAGGQLGASVTLAVRPENLHLKGDSRAIPLGTAKVSAVTFQGSFKRILAESDLIPRQSFVARTVAGLETAVGDTVTPCCNPEDMILLVS